MFTQEQMMEFDYAKNNIHYFANLVLPCVYKQQAFLFDSYTNNQNVLSIVSRQSGTTTAEAIFALWKLIFENNATIGYCNTNSMNSSEFGNIVSKLNNNLPSHIKANLSKDFVNVNNKSRLICRPMTSSSFRGLTLKYLIVGEFHYLKYDNLIEFIKNVLPPLSVYNGKLIMSSSINFNGFKLYELINVLSNVIHPQAIPFNHCSHYTKNKDDKLKSVLSIERYLSEYYCIDREGIDYAK